MSETQDEDEIIVIGRRLKATNDADRGGGGGSSGNMLPVAFFDHGTLQPTGDGLDTPRSAPIIGMNDDKHFDIPGVTVDLVVPEDTWQKLTADQRRVVTHIVKNATNDPNSEISKAIKHTDIH